MFKNNFLAPTSYQVEKVNLTHTPAYSFGLKIKQERYTSNTPGIKVL